MTDTHPPPGENTPFDSAQESPSVPIDRFTLVNGRTFTVSAPDGSLGEGPEGTVFEDLRMMSRFRIGIDRTADQQEGGLNRQLLGRSNPTPFHAAIVSRPEVRSDGDFHEYYVHRQWVGRGVRHDIEIHNTGSDPIRRELTVELDSDFAHIFDVKAGLRRTTTTSLTRHGDGWLLSDDGDPDRAVVIKTSREPTETRSNPVAFRWSRDIRPNANDVVSISVEPRWDGNAAGIAFDLETSPAQAWPATRLDRWRRLAPSVVTNDRRLSLAVDASIADLASLRIFDIGNTGRVVVAAGAPWFMTLFGRDSLLTSWMVMPFLPDLVVGTIDTLADLQGTVDQPQNEEQPGKILHELRRHGGDAAFADRGRYYGTVDATALFVMVIAEAARWGVLDRDAIRRLWPAITSALGWLRRSIKAGGGFVRYQRSTAVGLVNQGWKDSWDGISFADGRLPNGAVALIEVQGYAHAALLAGTELALFIDENDIEVAKLQAEADRLAERFDDHFWVETASSFAVGLDGDNRPIDSVTTNPGHAIWTGIADVDRANRYLDRIFDGDLFTGWGLRTLSPTAARYDPFSYHNGSVWPHDTSIVAAGAARLGRRDVVDRLLQAALDVAAGHDGRPPELFSGVDRTVMDIPVPYPSSCSPQAWSSASVLLHLRATLGLDPPDTPDGPPRIKAGEGVAASELVGVRVGYRRYRVTKSADGWLSHPV